MNILSAQELGARKLAIAKIPSAILDAEVLLSHVLKKPKEFIFTNPKNEISKSQEKTYKALIARRLKFEPLAYLTGNKEFYDLNFLVNKHVLIPRPETELLVESVINYTKKRQLNIVDVGTGSGAIAISLQKNLPGAKLIATDISKSALKVAQKNARLNQVTIKFIFTNLISNVPEKIDLIVANLPYVPIGEKKIKTIFSAPLKYEPAQALYAGKYGLDLYEKLFKQIKKLEKTPEIIFCEIGSTYTAKTKKLARTYFPKSKIEIKKDLCGKNRLMIIKN